MMLNWLTGEEPVGYREKVQAEREKLIDDIESGKIVINVSGDVAEVFSTERAATMVGYSCSPVVVALNPSFVIGKGEPHTKFTICQFEAGHVDMNAALLELSEQEEGWGGSPTIGGSPQGISSRLTMDQVACVVRKHLLAQ